MKCVLHLGYTTEHSGFLPELQPYDGLNVEVYSSGHFAIYNRNGGTELESNLGNCETLVKYIRANYQASETKLTVCGNNNL